MVVPPTLGMSIERWRATRRPGPADAARLTLAFGRLAERVAAAGFPVDAAGLADFAVGPGPTPFLERPLLGSPDTNAVLVGRRDGQRTLAAIFRAALGDDPPEPLAEWLEQTSGARFDDLGECLDELERCGNMVQSEQQPGDEGPIGLKGLFDERDYEARLVLPLPRVWPRRVAAGLGLLAVAAAVVALLAPRGAAPAARARSGSAAGCRLGRIQAGGSSSAPPSGASPGARPPARSRSHPKDPSPADSADIARDGALRPAAGLYRRGGPARSRRRGDAAGSLIKGRASDRRR